MLKTAVIVCGALLILFVSYSLVRGIQVWNEADVILAAKRPLPRLPSPNAFPLYVKAANAIADTSYNDARPRAPSADSPKSSKRKRTFTPAEKDALLRKNASALKQLRQAFKYEYREPPASPSFEASFAYYARYREMARLLAFEAEVRSGHGDVAGAMDSRLDAIRLGKDNSRGSGLLGRLVGIACSGIGRRESWSDLLRLDASGAKASARRMEALLAKHVPLSETLEVNKQWSLQTLREFEKNPEKYESSMKEAEESGEAYTPPTFSSSLMLRWHIRRSLKNYSEYMDRAIAEVRQPYPELNPEPEDPGDELTAILAPAPAAALLKESSDHAQNCLLTLAFALRAYRQERGRYPTSLNALVPTYLKSIPNDPFTRRQPFRYLLKGETYLLYSIGPDGNDDNGKPILNPDDPEDETPRERQRHSVQKDSKGDIVAGVNF